MTITPNRVATWLTAASGAAAAIAVPVANLDPTDLLPGLGAIAVAFTGWMTGWQKHEARVAAAKPTSVPRTTTPIYATSSAQGSMAINTGDIMPFVGGNVFTSNTATTAPPPDEDNSALEATDGDALAPTEPKIAGDE